MPTYQYACTACDHDLEAVQSFIDDPLTECPECGGALRKVFGNVGVVFKGSGFYRTDSRDSGTKKSGESKDSSPAKSDATSSSTTSSTPSSTPSSSSSSSTSSSAPAAS